MSDRRFCTICERLIDLDEPGIKVLQISGGNGSRTTVIDQVGIPHFVATKRWTKKMIEKGKVK
jgi:hypothetical protein